MKFDIRVFFENMSVNSSFIKIGQEWRVLDVKTHVYIWKYLAQFILEWEIFQTQFVYKIEKHFILKNFFFKHAPFMK
jgi:hypothetical protein